MNKTVTLADIDKITKIARQAGESFQRDHEGYDVDVWTTFNEELGIDVIQVDILGERMVSLTLEIKETTVEEVREKFEEALKDDYTWHLSAGQVGHLEREISKYVSASKEKGMDTDEDEVFKNLVIETLKTATADLNDN